MAYIKIKKENFYHNLSLLSKKAQGKERLAVVLKDNAYGHGIELIAKLSSNFGIKDAVVIDNKEAFKIKDLFKNILVLNDHPTRVKNFTYAIKDIKELYTLKPHFKIELKIDTGMHRNGIEFTQFYKALSLAKKKNLNVVGLFTHFRSADILSSEYFWQKKRWEEVKRVAKRFFKKVRFHSHNSAALIRSKSFNEDLARVGIAIYGYNELPKVYDPFLLKPIISLWAKKVSTRRLKKGERVGYGGDFIAPRDMVVSTYDLGYGDGWFRGDSKRAFVIKEGIPILGRVSMDFISLESIKKEVLIFDNAKEVAEHFNTISYEITTSLSPTLKRVVI
ncbi:MAG: alanine racemase [Epsilonproteobacteria bacterium]|nr:alanine racemase [Campylobacterota bacterium]